MRRHVLSSCCVVALLATPAMAEPWVRGYVVTNYEPAWYFGGNANFHKADLIEPGSDCPKGSFAELDWEHVLLTPWRDAKEVHYINHPPSADPNARLWLQQRALTFRGFRDGIDVYINPFAAPDPGMQEVTGSISEGFDLDGSAKTGGFSSPTGQKGIDNAFYRAWGCLTNYRDMPYHAAMSTRANDKMMEGLFTIVVRVSGNKDPMNDDDATVEIGFSPDKMIKAQGSSDILTGYSYRMARNEYTKFRASVKNGLVEENGPVDELHMPRIAWFPNQYGDADFRKARFRMTMEKDGTASGMIGGYRDWREVFSENHFSQTGSTEEYRDHQNAMAMYYALQRNADGLPDPKTGRKMGISTAYRFMAQPSFVVDPRVQTAGTVTMSPTIERQFKSYNALHASFYKALATHQIQPIPTDARQEGDSGHFRQNAQGKWVLRDELLSSPLEHDGTTPPPTKPADKKPQQQVLNGTPSTTR